MTAAQAVGLVILAAMLSALTLPRLGAAYERWWDRQLGGAWDAAEDRARDEGRRA